MSKLNYLKKTTKVSLTKNQKMNNKALLIAFIVLSYVGFVACSKDDNGDDSSGDIVGKWQFDNGGVIVEGQEVMYPYPHDCASKKDYIEFRSNGRGLDYAYNQACELEDDEEGWTWIVLDNNLKITDEHGIEL